MNSLSSSIGSIADQTSTYESNNATGSIDHQESNVEASKSEVNVIPKAIKCHRSIDIPKGRRSSIPISSRPRSAEERQIALEKVIAFRKKFKQINKKYANEVKYIKKKEENESLEKKSKNKRRRKKHKNEKKKRRSGKKKHGSGKKKHESWGKKHRSERKKHGSEIKKYGSEIKKHGSEIKKQGSERKKHGSERKKHKNERRKYRSRREEEEKSANVDVNELNTENPVETMKQKKSSIKNQVNKKSSKKCIIWSILSSIGGLVLLITVYYFGIKIVDLSELCKNNIDSHMQDIALQKQKYLKGQKFQLHDSLEKYFEEFKQKNISKACNVNWFNQSKVKSLIEEKIIPKFVMLDMKLKVKVTLENNVRFDLRDMYKLEEFDEQNKKPIYVHPEDDSISLRYYQNLWSVVKKTNDSKNEYKVLIVWKSSKDVDHPGKLDSTTEVILCNVDKIYGVPKDDTTKEINTEVEVFYD